MKVTNLVVTKSLIGQAEDLAKEHELFNQQYVIAGRTALYGLLQRIMKLTEAFDASPDKSDLVKLLRVELQEKHGIKTQDNSSDTSILVRFITRADRKTAHVYARAIETAKANSISSESFVDYVQEQGGIERLRGTGVDPQTRKLNKQADYQSMQNMWEFLRILSETPCAKFKLLEGKNQCYGASSLHYFVACKRDGEYQIISEVPVDEDQEIQLLQPIKEAVSEQLEKDPESLAKLRKAIEAKKLKLNDNSVAQEGEEKCAA